jgi:hypothetical protein
MTARTHIRGGRRPRPRTRHIAFRINGLSRLSSSRDDCLPRNTRKSLTQRHLRNSSNRAIVVWYRFTVTLRPPARNVAGNSLGCEYLRRGAAARTATHIGIATERSSRGMRNRQGRGTNGHRHRHCDCPSHRSSTHAPSNAARTATHIGIATPARVRRAPSPPPCCTNGHTHLPDEGAYVIARPPGRTASADENNRVWLENQRFTLILVRPRKALRPGGLVNR